MVIEQFLEKIGKWISAIFERLNAKALEAERQQREAEVQNIVEGTRRGVFSVLTSQTLPPWLPVSKLSDLHARRYKIWRNGVKVEFAVLKSSKIFVPSSDCAALWEALNDTASQMHNRFLYEIALLNPSAAEDFYNMNWALFDGLRFLGIFDEGQHILLVATVGNVPK